MIQKTKAFEPLPSSHMFLLSHVAPSLNILSFILFADDSNIFLSQRDPQILLDKINFELVYVQDWIRANKLSLNINKTHYMIFSNSIDSLPGPVSIDGKDLQRVQYTKFLGILIDDRLSWKFHIDNLCRLVSRNIGVINKLKRKFPFQILLSPYMTLILAWFNSSKNLNNRIFILQKRILRIIHNVHFRSHTDILFFDNKILKIEDLYNWHLGIFMFQLSQNGLPSSLIVIFTRNYQIHSYPTRQLYQYHFSLLRTSLAQ